jgi:ribonuclease P protein component
VTGPDQDDLPSRRPSVHADGGANARPEVAVREAVARLKKRADFVAAAKGRRQHQRCFSLQMRARQTDAARAEGTETPRFGFTVTKKVGNSVVRNRIRRRLREAVRLMDPALAQPSHDYVLVARIEALAAPFQDLREELLRALKKIHRPRESRPAAPSADTRQDR